MSEQLVSDEFWKRVQSLLPRVERRFRHPGRKRIDDRLCLESIMYVLKTGCQWALVPAGETRCSGKTAWRRMDEWDRAGVWDALHESLLAELNAGGEIDWSTGVIDAGSQRAVFGAFHWAQSRRQSEEGRQEPRADRRHRPADGRVSQGR